MPSKLRKALGAVKDQTSISLAKVTNAANLEVTILKATTHDKNPIGERYVNEILNILSSNKVYAAACAHCIGKRIGKTRNWVVTLKSLMIVLRIFQDGDPYFPRELFHAMKRGAKILNLSSFKDDPNSSLWDYTAFIRTFALYLNERLDCFLTGKLQRRFMYHNQFHERNQKKSLYNEPGGIKDMKPTMVLDRIAHWQRLLDKAIGTRPTGLAKTNRLVQVSLYAIVQESFDLYKDISAGLVVILDSFFNLPFLACVAAFNVSVKSCKQFDELSVFYSFCESIGVGRSNEYPRVQKISQEIMETLQEFLKDQASENNGSKDFIFPPPKDLTGSNSTQNEATERYETLERFFETGPEFGPQCTSLEDLMIVVDATMNPRRSLDQDICLEKSDQDEKESLYDDYVSAIESFPIDQTSRSSLDVVSFDELQLDLQQNQTNLWEQQNTNANSYNNSKDCWELVLAKTITAPIETSPQFVTLFDQALVPQEKYNPFLDDTITVDPLATSSEKLTPTQTFDTQDPIVSTFSDQSSSSIANLCVIFDDMCPNETTFRAQGPYAQTNMIVPSTFNTKTSDKMITTPSFQDDSSFKNDSIPTFQVHKSNVDAIMEAPIFTASQNPNSSIIPIQFQEQNLHASTMPPTFSVNDCNEATLATSIEDDPFGPWPSASSANAQILYVSNQDDTLLQQQQLWLEQQQKIIFKHLT